MVAAWTDNGHTAGSNSNRQRTRAWLVAVPAVAVQGFAAQRKEGSVSVMGRSCALPAVLLAVGLRHTQVHGAVPAGDRPVMGFGVLCRQLRRPLLAGRALEREWCAPLNICDGFRCSCCAVWLLCVACWVIGGRVSGAVPVVQTASVTWTCDAPERLDGPPVHTHTVGHTDCCTAEYRTLVLSDSHRPNTQGMLASHIPCDAKTQQIPPMQYQRAPARLRYPMRHGIPCGTVSHAARYPVGHRSGAALHRANSRAPPCLVHPLLQRLLDGFRVGALCLAPH
jgi:hypothetical protein